MNCIVSNNEYLDSKSQDTFEFNILSSILSESEEFRKPSIFQHLISNSTSVEASYY